MQEKTKLSTVIILFSFIFLTVTGGIYYLNTICENIFAFNFKPVTIIKKTPEQIQKQTATAYMDSLSRKFRKEMLDSLNTYSLRIKDSVNMKIDAGLIDSLSKMKGMLQKTAVEDSINKSVREFAEKTKNDTLYNKWVKKTAVLYEAMDAKKAAKIIQNYSDNIARDILYIMKKKKAAEILANLSPDIANRFTRIR